MKIIAITLCLLPVFAFATGLKDMALQNNYEELCAKEQDPVKRLNYCHALEQLDHHAAIAEPFRRDIAIA